MATATTAGGPESAGAHFLCFSKTLPLLCRAWSAAAFTVGLAHYHAAGFLTFAVLAAENFHDWSRDLVTKRCGAAERIASRMIGGRGLEDAVEAEGVCSERFWRSLHE